MILKLTKVDDALEIERVRKALLEMFDFDLDMSGENGEEYLWPDAKGVGFSSNNEYLVSLAAQYKTCPKDIFECFAKMFFGAHENSEYYAGYELEFVEAGDSLIVALATTTR